MVEKVQAERAYATQDRSEWPKGPWDDEPFDKLQWLDEATDYDCLAVRNRMGAWCGYVGLPQTHPWHGLHYASCGLTPPCGEPWCHHSPDSVIAVHGGITYSDLCQEGDEDESICHVPLEGRPDTVWWFGFDTCHLGDLVIGMIAYKSPLTGEFETYRDINYVQDQVVKLAQQLQAIERERQPKSLGTGSA